MKAIILSPEQEEYLDDVWAHTLTLLSRKVYSGHKRATLIRDLRTIVRQGFYRDYDRRWLNELVKNVEEQKKTI